MIDATDAENLPLDARLIESRLSQLWRLEAEGTVGGVVHASTLTLLVMLLDEGLAGHKAALLAEIGPAHPCRAILVTMAAAEPRACLGAFCSTPSAGRPAACWEEIRLVGNRAALLRMLSVVQSLVLPNLPVQVWWPGDVELDSELFERVVEIGDRMIVDSSQFADPLTSLARYADRAVDQHGIVGFADLSWRRLEPWRLLTAQFFDSPADRAILNDISSVTVGFEGPTDGRGGFAQALLFVSWLASRLGWTLAAQPVEPRRDLDGLHFDDGGRSVRVGFERRERAATTGGLLSVDIRGQHKDRSARYAVERSGESANTLVEASDGRREAQVALPALSELWLLQQELASFGRDRIYEDALAVIRELGHQIGLTNTSA